MKMSKIKIKNYRNFMDEEINFNNETVIIGPNDVGKTNLLMAIRLLLDKSLSYLELEPQEKDFNIFSNENEITIILEFSDINEVSESYILANLGTDIEDGKFYLMYKGFKENDEKFKFYISAKENEESFHEIPGRNKYLSLVNCVYLDSTRQLKQFLKKSKANMIKSYKLKRSSEEIDSDNEIISRIETQVDNLNESVESVSYINKSTEFIKTELGEMSSQNENMNIRFSSFNDPDDIMNNVELITEIDGKNVSIGGDGRSNQIYMSMWVKEMNERFDEKKQFVIYLLEEPESHLHFPLQSMTIRQILKKIKSQFIVTSHSPQVVLEFNPYSIIRLYFDKRKKTLVANKGCSKKLEDELVDFGYRYNLITGSMFYSSGVFLVEGISEILLYKHICKKIGIDLEKYNILIVSVEGIGFKPYIRLLNQLSIPYSIRTDNDITLNSQNEKYYYSGINRLIDYHNETTKDDISKTPFSGLENKILNPDSESLLNTYKIQFEKEGLFMSNKDLETDLSNVEFLTEYISATYDGDKQKFVDYLQKSKAKNMYSFISDMCDVEITKERVGELYKPIEWLLNKTNE